MPIPYEPILRHEPIAGAAPQCLQCQYDVLNHPCTESECGCLCKVPLAPEFFCEICRSTTHDAAGHDPARDGGGVVDLNDHRDPLPPDPDTVMLMDWDPAAEDMEAYRAADSPSFKRVSHIDFDDEVEIGRSDDKHPATKPRNVKIKEFIAKWELPWAVLTTMLYLGAVILLVTVFPDVSNTWVSVFVLVSGLTASLTALASVLKTKE